MDHMKSKLQSQIDFFLTNNEEIPEELSNCMKIVEDEHKSLRSLSGLSQGLQQTPHDHTDLNGAVHFSKPRGQESEDETSNISEFIRRKKEKYKNKRIIIETVDNISNQAPDEIEDDPNLTADEKRELFEKKRRSDNLHALQMKLQNMDEYMIDTDQLQLNKIVAIKKSEFDTKEKS